MPVDEAPEHASEARERALLTALSHEIGNLLAAIRLSAHLLSGEPERAGDYARQLDGLAAHAGALLAQIRPLASGLGGTPMAIAVSELLEGVEYAVATAERPSALRIDAASARGLRLEADPERLHNALVLLVWGALESGGADGGVGLAAAAEGEWVEIALSDGGPPIEPDAGGSAARGRPLAVQVARELLARDGARVSAPNPPRPGQVVLRLPRARGR